MQSRNVFYRAKPVLQKPLRLSPKYNRYTDTKKNPDRFWQNVKEVGDRTSRTREDCALNSELGSLQCTGSHNIHLFSIS